MNDPMGGGDMMAGPQGASAAPPAALPDDTGEEGYTICIQCRPDGTFRVYKETEAMESTEPAGPDTGQETGTPDAGPMAPGAGPEEVFDSLEGALKQAVRLYKSNPLSENPQGQFEAGFSPTPGSETY